MIPPTHRRQFHGTSALSCGGCAHTSRDVLRTGLCCHNVANGPEADVCACVMLCQAHGTMRFCCSCLTKHQNTALLGLVRHPCHPPVRACCTQGGCCNVLAMQGVCVYHSAVTVPVVWQIMCCVCCVLGCVCVASKLRSLCTNMWHAMSSSALCGCPSCLKH